jgi:hypothetical protein
VYDAREVAPGSALTVRLHRGALGCRVESVEPVDPVDPVGPVGPDEST